MELTQQHVIEALEQRKIFVNKRRLTDWISKGLLPPLSKHRDRLGRISRYVWTQDNIIEQAETVAQLLALYGRARRTRMVFATLWLLGYEVDREKAINALRTIVVDVWTRLERQIDPSQGKEELEDVISEIAVSHTTTKTGWTRNGMDQVADAIEVFMLVCTLPDFSISSDLISRVMTWKPNTNPFLTLSEDTAETWARILGRLTEIRNMLALPRLCEALSSSSKEDYDLARLDFVLLVDCVTHFVAELNAAEPRLESLASNVPEVKLPAVSVMGPWIIALDLAIRQAGYGERIEVWLRWTSRTIWRYFRDQSNIDTLQNSYSRMHVHTVHRLPSTSHQRRSRAVKFKSS